MTGRDRIVVMVLAVLAVVAGGWILVVSPERKQASKLSAQVEAAKAELATAEGQLANARAAQSQYASAYTSIVNLGKAVPANQELPSLIYELAHATSQDQVDFNSITSSSATASSTTGAAAAGAAATKTAPTGFTQMPFTFIFNGGFFDLEHLFAKLTAFTTRTTSGTLKISGRLLTIQSVKLAPVQEATAGAASKVTTTPKLSGTITATAYQLPGGIPVTGGATSTSPTGATSPATSTTGAGGSATAPAIARVTP
jgi:Tfp pilus assembly protein PilO